MRRTCWRCRRWTGCRISSLIWRPWGHCACCTGKAACSEARLTPYGRTVALCLAAQKWRHCRRSTGCRTSSRTYHPWGELIAGCVSSNPRERCLAMLGNRVSSIAKVPPQVGGLSVPVCAPYAGTPLSNKHGDGLLSLQICWPLRGQQRQAPSSGEQLRLPCLPVAPETVLTRSNLKHAQQRCEAACGGPTRSAPVHHILPMSSQRLQNELLCKHSLTCGDRCAAGSWPAPSCCGRRNCALRTAGNLTLALIAGTRPASG